MVMAKTVEATSSRLRPPLWRRLVWHVTWLILKPLFFVMYRLRIKGQYVPAKGGVLILANHQSFADPILLGMASPYRPIYSVGRKTLWSHSRLVSFMLDTYNAFPIDIENMDMAAMRRCIDILRADEGLVMYPEGTRTHDGSIGEFASGLYLLIKRSKTDVVPAAIDGAYDVWSRHHDRPQLRGRITVNIGETIPSEQLLAMDGQEAVAMIRERIVQLYEEMRNEKAN